MHPGTHSRFQERLRYDVGRRETGIPDPTFPSLLQGDQFLTTLIKGCAYGQVDVVLGIGSEVLGDLEKPLHRLPSPTGRTFGLPLRCISSIP